MQNIFHDILISPLCRQVQRHPEPTKTGRISMWTLISSDWIHRW